LTTLAVLLDEFFLDASAGVSGNNCRHVQVPEAKIWSF